MTSRDDEIEALKSITGALFKQLRTITAEAHAIRVMLNRRGLYDAAEYEQVHAESLAEFDQLLSQTLTEALSSANAEAALRLLRNYQGKPQ